MYLFPSPCALSLLAIERTPPLLTEYENYAILNNTEATASTHNSKFQEGKANKVCSKTGAL